MILIGHRGHPEVEGTMGQYDTSAGGRMYLVEDLADVQQLQVMRPHKLSYVTQTTLSMDDTARVIEALRARFPAIRGPRKDDICYATQNRQDAVRELSGQADVVLVVGSPNSSNSNRLRELAEQQGVPGYLLDSPDQIQEAWLQGKQTVAVTAGASAPEVLVQQVIARLEETGADAVLEQTGRVWEWCSNSFHAYEGFTPFPYEEYSGPWFDDRHYSLRGGSLHTRPAIKRPSFRNFFEADKRHVFAGLRLVY